MRGGAMKCICGVAFVDVRFFKHVQGGHGAFIPTFFNAAWGCVYKRRHG